MGRGPGRFLGVAVEGPEPFDLALVEGTSLGPYWLARVEPQLACREEKAPRGQSVTQAADAEGSEEGATSCDIFRH